MKFIRIVAFCSLLFAYDHCFSQEKAVFSNFFYHNDDKTTEYDPNEEYLNPVIRGFYPDPSVCRKGEDFYLVNSSFAYYPGIPIWHSTDLVNWKQLGYVLNRKSQLDIKDVRMSRGIYAPDIKYNEQNNTFYVIYTTVDMGGNFYVKTTNPKSNHWSSPIPLPEVGGIDPSFFFDIDGKAYIVNNDAPSYPAEYDGHRAIWIHEFDVKTGKIVKGTSKVIIDKGTNPEKKPIWIEGPHLYRVNNKYYLMAAEGGTAEAHSEVIFSADSVMGPYKQCPINPILTQRNLQAGRKDAVTCTGHADLVQDINGNWFSVFLGCRPYKDDFYNTGRETFLLPVTWNDEQPVILKEGESVPMKLKKSMLRPENRDLTGNCDDFMANRLSNQWNFIRTPQDPINKWYQVGGGKLTITPRPVTLDSYGNPSFIGERVISKEYTATVHLDYLPLKEGEFAGMACFYNDEHFYTLGKTVNSKGKMVIRLSGRNKDKTFSEEQLIPNKKKLSELVLKVKQVGDKMQFSYFFQEAKAENKIEMKFSEQDATVLSTKVAGGFTGAYIGMYASTTDKDINK